MFVGTNGVSFAAKRGDRTIPLWALSSRCSCSTCSGASSSSLESRRSGSFPGSPRPIRSTSTTCPTPTASLPRCCGRSPRPSHIGRSVPSGVAPRGHGSCARRVLPLGARPRGAPSDLPLYDNAAKVGLGLWNYPAPAFLLEVAVLFGGMFLYLRSTTTTTRLGRYGMPVFGVVMLAVQAVVFFGPPPSSDRAAQLRRSARTSCSPRSPVAGAPRAWTSARPEARSCAGRPSAHTPLLITYRR